MASFVIYIFNRVLNRISDFIYHWYIDSSKIYADTVVSFLEKLDRKIAFKITLRYFFHPLYQDRSFFGYFFGFLLRGARLIFGAIFYAFVFLFIVAIYGVWLAIPIYLIFKATTTNPWLRT